MSEQLTSAMQRALAKVTDVWLSATRIDADIRTLDALAARGLVDRKYEKGAADFPRQKTLYRLAEQKAGKR